MNNQVDNQNKQTIYPKIPFIRGYISRCSLLLFFFSWILFTTNIFAQKSEPATQFWVSGGMGQSISDAFTKGPGLVAGAGFSFSTKQQLVSLQINHFWETNMGEKMQGDFNEWKIQYGLIHTKKKGQFYVIGGLGYSECNHFRAVFHGDGLSIQKENTTETAFGFVAETGVNFVLTKHIGIGIASFANFNKNALAGGYRINILLGLFKNYKR